MNTSDSRAGFIGHGADHFIIGSEAGYGISLTTNGNDRLVVDHQGNIGMGAPP
jgi:hypothetical protein